jgi:hypothetical protein
MSLANPRHFVPKLVFMLYGGGSICFPQDQNRPLTARTHLAYGFLADEFKKSSLNDIVRESAHPEVPGWNFVRNANSAPISDNVRNLIRDQLLEKGNGANRFIGLMTNNRADESSGTNYRQRRPDQAHAFLWKADHPQAEYNLMAFLGMLGISGHLAAKHLATASMSPSKRIKSWVPEPREWRQAYSYKSDPNTQYRLILQSIRPDGSLFSYRLWPDNLHEFLAHYTAKEPNLALLAWKQPTDLFSLQVVANPDSRQRISTRSSAHSSKSSGRIIYADFVGEVIEDPGLAFYINNPNFISVNNYAVKPTTEESVLQTQNLFAIRKVGTNTFIEPLTERDVVLSPAGHDILYVGGYNMFNLIDGNTWSFSRTIPSEFSSAQRPKTSEKAEPSPFVATVG